MKQSELNFEEQRGHLERVNSAIARTIVAFLRSRETFHADELRLYVAQRHPTAPGSADRILRDLRQRGIVDYHVVNRRASLYRVGRDRSRPAGS